MHCFLNYFNWNILCLHKYLFLLIKPKVCRTMTDWEELHFRAHIRIIVTKGYLSSIWSHRVWYKRESPARYGVPGPPEFREAVLFMRRYSVFHHTFHPNLACVSVSSVCFCKMPHGQLLHRRLKKKREKILKFKLVSHFSSDNYSGRNCTFVI